VLLDPSKPEREATTSRTDCQPPGPGRRRVACCRAGPGPPIVGGPAMVGRGEAGARSVANIPDFMTAIAIPVPGGPDVLVPERRPVPAPGAEELLVAVAAAGVNRPDVLQRQGHYPPPKGAPDIPG